MKFARTIAAISTPPGKGGVAVIRISGESAADVGRKIFSPRGKYQPYDKPRVQIYGDILFDGSVIDDGLLTYFKAPNSYTGEDVVEISCHGGKLLTSKVLEAALMAGADYAEAGEFTRRAFLSGKLSLTETEAIGMLLEADTVPKIWLSGPTSRGKLANAVFGMGDSIRSLLSSIYARIDYPEEDLGEFSDDEITSSLSGIIAELDALIETYKVGHAIGEGMTTVIAGKPNVGKSTLYNLLLGENAAIVTDIPGTTRDVLEKTLSISNYTLRVYDTAGIRENTSDTVERIGIERSIEKLRECEIAFLLFDSSSDPDSDDERILSSAKSVSGIKIAILTKCDRRDSKIEEYRKLVLSVGFDAILEISSEKDPEGAIAAVTDTLDKLLGAERVKLGEDAIVSSARQHASLMRAREYLCFALSAYEAGIPRDAAASDIELALGAISEIDGREVTEEIVTDIFSKFCVGK